MEYRSNPSDEKPFCLRPGRGEEILSFVGAPYLPLPLPGSLEGREEKAEKARESFGRPGREAEGAWSLLEASLGLSLEVARFFSVWESLLPDLSGAYRFLRLENGEVLLEALERGRIKRKKFDEAEIEKALND
ncbi:MAG: hypothetical protein IKT06_03085, partial [Aeriscardovia sp.]|nr:hypothetical protein [Aeriscardovia sp.]